MAKTDVLPDNWEEDASDDDFDTKNLLPDEVAKLKNQRAVERGERELISDLYKGCPAADGSVLAQRPKPAKEVPKRRAGEGALTRLNPLDAVEQLDLNSITNAKLFFDHFKVAMARIQCPGKSAVLLRLLDLLLQEASVNMEPVDLGTIGKKANKLKDDKIKERHQRTLNKQFTRSKGNTKVGNNYGEMVDEMYGSDDDYEDEEEDDDECKPNDENEAVDGGGAGIADSGLTAGGAAGDGLTAGGAAEDGGKKSTGGAAGGDGGKKSTGGAAGGDGGKKSKGDSKPTMSDEEFM